MPIKLNTSHKTKKTSEQYLYGSSRLGVYMPELDVSVAQPKSPIIPYFTGKKQYELTNHLGNVLATIKDEKQQVDFNNDGRTDYYDPIVLNATDYYPFGMPMPERSFSLSSKGYRFGFNTQEKDDEVYGAGNLMSAQYWEYDTRIGRRWNIDPIVKLWESPYLVNSGNPIWFSDPNGDDKIKTKDIASGKKKFDAKKDVAELPKVTVKAYKLSAVQRIANEFKDDPNKGPLDEFVNTVTAAISKHHNDDYSPFNPDAVSMSVEAGVNMITADVGFGITSALSKDDAAIIPNANVSTGGGKPGFYFSAQINVHNKYGTATNILKELGGLDLTTKVGAVLIMGYSRSAQFDKINIPKYNALKGAETYSLGIGFDVGYSKGISRSPEDPYTLNDAIKTIKNYWNK